jgi:polysaccharide export outer membrane protein
LKQLSGLLLVLLLLSSCKVFYPDRLFKIDKEKLAMADTLHTPKQYLVRPGDFIALGVFSNNGYQLVDVLTPGGVSFSAMQYLVKANGYVLLPMLDSVYVVGSTVDQLEKMLAKKYEYYFVNPFIRIEVTNRSVYVFRGRGSAQIVTLTRDNMNLLEVIAEAGGVPIGAKAFRVRVLRGSLNAPTVFDIDLSTVEGMQRANLTMVADDLVYIETRLTFGDVFAQFTPFFAAIATLLALYVTLDATFGN